MPEVTIVGAGIAGLAAALRLLQRGFHVRLCEQDEFIGGKWGALRDPRATDRDRTKPVYHEHCYHMFLNWFHNFWDIVDELELRDRFEPRMSLKYLRRGGFPNFAELSNVGSIGSFWSNVFSGVLPVPDMLIYNYSLIDLIAEPIHRGEFLDQYSVNGFMRSRLYATDAAALHHQRTLAKAFACPSYLTSASTYKSFIKYGFRQPDPMMWVLRGNCQEHFHDHLRRRLERHGDRFRLDLKTRADRLHLDASGRIASVELSRLDGSPSVDSGRSVKVLERESWPIAGDLILAVPPSALTALVDPDIFRVAPELGDVRKLRSEPMASADLYFKKRLPDVPKEHVVLLGSKYDLTFIDNGQLWPDETTTALNLVASEFDPLEGLPAEKALHYMIEELRSYVDFDLADIDQSRTYIQTNTGERLFVNQVGSWPFRPRTTCRIPNLFIAGDFCQTFIDVVTIEAAVVSGLQAAEAIRQKAGAGRPIRIVQPDFYPESMMAALAMMWAPYAYGAKLWAWGNELFDAATGVQR
jgi:Flavin containing amine oxidoreductase